MALRKIAHNAKADEMEWARYFLFKQALLEHKRATPLMESYP